MAMPHMAGPVTTVEDLLALPDDGLRHELLDGEHVVTPAPRLRHQDVLARLFARLVQAVEPRPDLRILSSPADLIFGSRTLLQPDLFVFRQDPARPAVEWSDVGTPILAIEILSPTTASRDRGAKRRIYQRLGVDEYWIVDPDARLIERWTPSDARPEVLSDRLTWSVDGELLLHLTVSDVFPPLPESNP